MFVIPVVDENEKPGFIVGRVLRTDTNTVIDYQQVSLDQKDKDGKAIEPEKIRKDFEKMLKTKADGYLAKIKGSLRGAPLAAN